MSSRPKKSQTGRDKKQARDRAHQERLLRVHPARAVTPPFSSYDEWFSVPEEAAGMIEHPLARDPRLSEESREILGAVMRLGPRYRNMVPLAAVLLDQNFASGEIPLALPDKPGHVTMVPLAELAAEASDPQHLRELRERYPDVGDLPDPDGEPASLHVTDDSAAMHIHELHLKGALLVDENGAVHFARPPQKLHGKWQIAGR